MSSNQSVRVIPTAGVLAAGLASTLVAGSTTVTSVALFGNVLAGQKVFGPGIPYGTTVTAKASPSSITISKAATLAGAKTLQYGYFTAAIYAAGDALGWYFPIPLSTINGLFVVDKIKVITAVKLYIYEGEPVSTPQLDNAAYAPDDADAGKLVGYYSLTGSVVLTNNQVVFPASAELPNTPICGRDLWGQLVVVGTPTLTAIDNLILNISGE